MNFSNKISVLIAFLFVACNQLEYIYYSDAKPITDYKVNPDVITRDGVQIDTSGNFVDLLLLDNLVSDFEQCASVSVIRIGFVVKIAPDWHISPCTQAQKFNCRLPEATVRRIEEETGKKATAQCPFGCAGVVQPPNILVVTPNLKAFKHELIHLVLNTDDHSNPIFRRCE